MNTTYYRGIPYTIRINSNLSQMSWSANINGTIDGGTVELKHEEDIPLMQEALRVSAETIIDEYLDEEEFL